MAGFQGQLVINAVVPPSLGRWRFLADYFFYGPGSYGFDVNGIQVGDTVIVQSTSPVAQAHRFTIDEINGVGGGGPEEIDFYAVYDDTGSEPAGIGASTAMVTTVYENTFIAVPSSVWCQVDEFLIEYVNTKNAEKIESGGNKIIQGQSGFAAHELDGSNNDVNSYIEWDSTDQTNYHRVEPQQDGQDLDVTIGFQLPSQFIGLRDTGNAFEFYSKADNGSGDVVNYAELVSIIDTDGTEYSVTGEQVTSASRTLTSLTKAEIDSILNPTPASSSSSSTTTREWDTNDAGSIVYARFKLFGNLGDNIYLDQNNAFMYIK
jgi:hypothetical protein